MRVTYLKQNMMKKILFLIVLSAYTLAVSAQTYQKLEAGINGIGVSLEMPVSHKITIEPFIGLGPSYYIHNNNYELSKEIRYSWALLEPSFHGSVYAKYFYSKNSRIEKGKSLLFNSGNFIGVKVKYVSKTLSIPQYYCNTLILNLNWGGQFNLGKHWMYGYSVGIGYGYNLDTSLGLLYPALDLKIAYVLPFFSKLRK